jgi:hypothetical protein
MNRLEFLLSLGSTGLLRDPEITRKRPRFVSRYEDPIKSMCNYAQSYVTHITHNKENQARINIEARCIWRDTKSGVVKDYFKFASCKSENTYAEKDLFMDPNYDFAGVYNEENYVIFRSRQFHGSNYAERGESKLRFEGVRVELLEEKKNKKLEDNHQIVEATLEGKALVGRTTFNRSETEEITLEYPIKTINVNDSRWIYQVDTGPLAVPHPNKKDIGLLEALELAFIAYNTSDICYFVFNSPTPVEGLADVRNTHYSEIIELKNVTNEIFAIG